MVIKHIAEIDYKAFFKEYFNNESDFDEFYKKLNSNEQAPKMLHQTARIISLADKLDDYIVGRPCNKLIVLHNDNRTYCKTLLF